MVNPLSAGLFLMLSGVSPCATCQTFVPSFRFNAVMVAYGGFRIGRPCTVRPPPPSPPPPPPAGPAPRPAGGAAFGLRATPCTIVMSERPSCGGTRPRACAPEFEKMYRMFVSGSSEPPCQLAPPVTTGEMRVPSGLGHVLVTGGVNSGPIL